MKTQKNREEKEKEKPHQQVTMMAGYQAMLSWRSTRLLRTRPAHAGRFSLSRALKRARLISKVDKRNGQTEKILVLYIVEIRQQERIITHAIKWKRCSFFLTSIFKLPNVTIAKKKTPMPLPGHGQLDNEIVKYR